MSDVAKKARAAMKAKADRLGSSRPLEKVDSSTWTPPGLLNADVKTGMRPISRRAFKKGGKVVGDVAPQRADRVQRAGKKPVTPDSFVNKNVKEANEEREGIKHIGGMKKGGRAAYATKGGVRDYSVTGKDTVTERPIPMPPRRPADLPGRDVEPSDLYDADQLARAERGYKKGGRTKKMVGGPMMGAQKMMDRAAAVSDVPSATMNFSPIKKGSISPARAVGMKKGGGAKHPDVAEDKALIKKMVKPEARTGKADGGQSGKMQLSPFGEKMRRLSELKQQMLRANPRTTDSGDWGDMQAERSRLEADIAEGSKGMKGMGRTGRATGGQVFSGPGYPGKIPGVVSGGRTARAAGGKAKGKGKTAINIVINAGKPVGQDMDGMPPMPPGGPGKPPGAMPIAVPPAMAGGMPPGAGAPMPMPPGLAGAGGPPGMPPMPPGGMPPMGRKSGGRTYRSYKDMDAGAGSGEGRLEKTEIADHKRSERKFGGKAYRSYKDMDAGAASGEGRLEKAEIASRKSRIEPQNY